MLDFDSQVKGPGQRNGCIPGVSCGAFSATLCICAKPSCAGTSAIQVAKKLGAKVFVTASSKEKLDFCKELGADVLINYKEQNFVEIVQQETQGPELKVHPAQLWFSV